MFRAIGYTGRPLPGLPFDERTGLIPNERGRVSGFEATYVAGWIKRGPSGVSGTNKKCATDTVTALLEDADAGKLGGRGIPSAEQVERMLRTRRAEVVTYAGWEAIDVAERIAAEPYGRPRIKLTRVDELLEAAGGRPRTAV
jgi:ferredoxin--NADP+ reductase